MDHTDDLHNSHTANDNHDILESSNHIESCFLHRGLQVSLFCHGRHAVFLELTLYLHLFSFLIGEY
ncbi:unnamed protein product [Haemonchus placei]|uniref:Uncharacterized protein n=1 Tax=Haemonchus placei TaxID=6290 RepID=A0A3P7Z4C0_HAEPC|nr:unnamed protein product [Haemonchus placei]